jgi:RimJ/RimL family protein N-acetyltransferase
MIPSLETERTILRAPRPEDFEAYAAFRASPRARFIGGAIGRGPAWRSYAAILGHWQLRGYGLFAVEEKATGAWIGHVGLWYPEDWLVNEIAWTIGSAGHEGRGFAAEAARAARAYAYKTVGWTDAFSVIDPENVRSAALAERLGCTIDRRTTCEGRAVDIWRHAASEAA